MQKNHASEGYNFSLSSPLVGNSGPKSFSQDSNSVVSRGGRSLARSSKVSRISISKSSRRLVREMPAGTFSAHDVDRGAIE